MLSSPRRPSNTMRIFSSAEYCLRVARRMSWTTFSAGSLDDRVCCLIFAPCERYDEPETLPSSICQFCLTSADGGQFAEARFGCYIVRQNKRPVRYAPNRVLDCTRYC